MKKLYILVLTAMTMTAMTSAAERSVVKYLQQRALLQSARPTEDFTGATADSLIVFAGGEYDGEMMTNGYAYQKQVFEKSETFYAVNDYEMVFGEWRPTTRVETEKVSEDSRVVTHYYNHGAGDLIPFYRVAYTLSEGFEEIQTEYYVEGDWKITQYYVMSEANGLRSEETYTYEPDGNTRTNSLIYFDEQGQVEKQSYTYIDETNPEYSQIDRTLIGSYNEDGTIHILQDDYIQFVTEIDPETGLEHISIYTRYDVANPFILSEEGIETADSFIERSYDDGQLSYESVETMISKPDYMGIIFQTTEMGFDPETGEVEFGYSEQTYYPQPDNEELIEKVVTYDWLEENVAGGKDPWAWDDTTEYKYVEGFLYQVQLHGPFTLGDENSDYLFGYTQYYYDELSTGISTVRDDESEAKQSFDLMGRRITDKVRGLYISNGKVVLNK